MQEKTPTNTTIHNAYADFGSLKGWGGRKLPPPVYN